MKIFYRKYLQTTLILMFVISFATITKAQIILPFEVKGELLVVKLTINKMEGQFIFDTGASMTVLDSVLAVKLGLKSEGTSRNSSAGGISTFNYINNYKISLTEKDNIICKKIIFTNLIALQELVGTEFAGIIGFDVLNKYITKIDYDTKTISLYEQLNKDETTTYTSIPFNLKNGIPIPQFNISFTLNNGEKFNGPILFDSGAGLTLMINTPFKESNQLSKKIGKTLISRTQDLYIENKLEQGAIKSITIGTYTLENLPINLTSTKAGVSSFSLYLGILGNKIINRFNIIVDFNNKMLYLKPNKNFNLPFEFPLSGIKFKKVKDKIFIYDILVGSEAEKLGLKRGQQLIAIDSYKENDMEEIKNRLRQEGKTITISVLADGKKKEVNLLLKNLL